MTHGCYVGAPEIGTAAKNSEDAVVTPEIGQGKRPLDNEKDSYKSGDFASTVNVFLWMHTHQL